ncbi:MAG: hypothetical protein QG623_447 [Patescibacteria group bacterium]|nr:hypothetical protein [Patescibacteria group bacterium]
MAIKKKDKQTVDESKVKALEERLSALERIQSEKLRPKSEVRTTGKKLFPFVIALMFSLFSALAIYGAASAVSFYASYGDGSALFWSILLLIILFGLVGAAAWSVHRSEWGYRFRFAVIVMIISASSIGFSAVLTQGHVERLIDRVGIGEKLRSEDRLLGDSAVYGQVVSVEDDILNLELIGGGNFKVDITSRTKIFPKDSGLIAGQVVAIVLESRTGEAKWIRVLPTDYPTT